MSHKYEIRVKGLLTSNWSEWFDGIGIEPQENGETLLRGTLPDQPALFGLLAKVRDLGMILIAVTRVEGPDF